MRLPLTRRVPTTVRTRGSVVLAATTVAVWSLVLGPSVVDASAGIASVGAAAGRLVAFRGLQVAVPVGWRVVDLAEHRHACIRLDRPSVYLGAASDQPTCPAHLIGGAPVMEIAPLTPRSESADGGPVRVVRASSGLAAVQLPDVGPVGVAVPGAGVLVTLSYGAGGGRLMKGILASGIVRAGGHVGSGDAVQRPPSAPGGLGVSVPGDYRGKGFDTCTAPSQTVMDAWRSSSDYESIGVYIGGVSMGCAQPNLSAAWVARQVDRGWHLLPVYVGMQAPCSGFANRLSYDVPTARAQGEAEAADAMDRAAIRGIVAPSTLYADMEGYDSSNARCVAAVMSYLSGWTYALHTGAYQSGVYSSASSGMHDLSTHYTSLGASRPDDIFIAWWNHQADVDGGSYVPADQWQYQQRVHQYEGQQSESHGGYRMQIDVDFLVVSTVVQEPAGCPTNLNFRVYPLLRWPTRGDRVRAAQCLLARTGFDPGPATAILNWRTAAASRAFKASRGLNGHDSSIAKYAWAALISAGTTRPLHMGSTGPWVRKAQRALTARLQTPIAIDGVFGRSMRAAVFDYQRTVGLTLTGTMGPVTWHALRYGR
jgi:hypothetical protein